MSDEGLHLSSTDKPDRTFADIPEQFWVASNDLAFAVRDRFPVSPGHTLVIPRRIVADWWQATPSERQALLELLDEIKADLDREFTPAGYNVGFNDRHAAGQTVFHLHLHVIPRSKGDMPDPSGGVRHVIPSKGNPVFDDGSDELAAARVLPQLPTELEEGLARKIDPAALTQQVLSLIDEGQRSATYKPALMLAILELAVERAPADPDADLGLRLPLPDIADRVMAYYWPQVREYPAAGDILRQANGPRMRVTKALQELSATTGIAPTVELDVVMDSHRQAYEKTRNSVVVALTKQPIPRLQRITSGGDFFPRPLYDDADFIPETGLRKGADAAIRLRRGVATALARNATLLRMAIENVWIREVASMNEID
ncbi:MAG: HIT family protein, partial [Actinomycetes bacterium]